MGEDVTEVNTPSSELKKHIFEDDHLAMGVKSKKSEENLSVFIDSFLEHKYKFFLLIVVITLLAFPVTFVATPSYNASARMQVEYSQGLSIFENANSLSTSNSQINTVLEIIKSGLVLDEVVLNKQLDIIAKPLFYPIIGEAFFRRWSGTDFAKPLLGLDNYAWGGEFIKVDSFVINESLIDKTFIVRKISHHKYELISNSVVIGQGVIGEDLDIDSNIVINISELKSRLGTEFTVIKRSFRDAVKSLSNSVTVSETSRHSGVVEIKLNLENPYLATDVVNQIVDQYIHQDKEKNTFKQKRVLSFLNSQIPKIKKKLIDSQATYNDYRSNRGSVSIESETSALLDRNILLDTEIFSLKQKKMILQYQFEDNHPKIRILNTQIKGLVDKKKDIDDKFKQLPNVQQEQLRLLHDVELNSSLYSKLVSVAQELAISEVGVTGNARVIEYAYLDKNPISPNIKMIFTIFLFFGLLISSILLLVLSNKRGSVILNSSMLESFGVSVLAYISFSLIQKKINKERYLKILSEVDSDDLSIEAIKSLRTTIQISMLKAQNNILMVSGATPGVGKSFVASNLAGVFAKAGKSVLLVDADLRRGGLHNSFDCSNSVGLTDMILTGDAVITKTEIDNLSFLPRGKSTNSSSELFLNPNFKSGLDRLSKEFNLVIIDTPPILAITDAAIIGRHVGTTLFVVKSGHSKMQEIKLAFTILKQANIPINGTVMNGVSYEAKGYAYRYEYRAEDE